MNPFTASFGNQRVLTSLVNALRPGGILYVAMPCEKLHAYLFPKRFFEQYTRWAAAEHIGDQYTREERPAR